MLVRLLISVIANLGLFVGITFVSGMNLGLYSYILYLFMLICGIPFLFITGNFSSCGLLFSSKGKIEKCTLSQYQNLYQFISFIIKLQFLFALFFTGIASVMLIFNLQNLSSCGPNMDTVLEAPFFAFLFAIILTPIQTRVRLMTISFMEEDGNDGNSFDERNVNSHKARVSYVVIKTATSILWIILCVWFCSIAFMKNNQKIPIPFDIPSLLTLILFAAIYILVSGTTKEFLGALKCVFSDRKPNVSEQAKYSESIAGLIKTLLCAGSASSIAGMIAILCCLEDSSVLAANYYVSLLGFLYSVFFCILLLIIHTIINRKN